MSNIYIAYEECKKRYNEIQKMYNEILEEKEELFAKTQVKAVKLDKITVDGGRTGNVFEDYLILKEKKQIDKRLKEIKIILNDRKILLDKKEIELRDSKEWVDKIYVYKYLDNFRVKKIIHLVPYEEAQIYRMLDEIKKSLKKSKMIENDKK